MAETQTKPAPGTDEAALETLRARVIEVCYRSPARDYHALQVELKNGERVRAHGPIVEPVRGAEVTLTGRFVPSPGGRDFSFRAGRVAAVAGEEVTAYLARRCGIGLPEAAALARAFGEEVLARLEDNPAIAREIEAVSPAAAEKIERHFRARAEGAGTALLRQAGARETTVRELTRLYGEGLAAALETNPYLPCLEASESLATGDALARLLSCEARPLRTEAAVVLGLNAAGRLGHIAVEDLEVYELARKAFGATFPREEFAQGVEALTRAGRVRAVGGRIAIEAVAQSEVNLAEALRRRTRIETDAVSAAPSRLMALAREQGRSLTEPEARELAAMLSRPLVLLQASVAREAAYIAFLARVFSLLNIEARLIVPSARVRELSKPLNLPCVHLREEASLVGELFLLLEADRLSLTDFEKLLARLPPNAALWVAGDPRRVGGAVPGAVFRDLWGCRALPHLTVTRAFQHPLAFDLERLFHGGAPVEASSELTGRVHVLYGTGKELLEAAQVLAREVLPNLGYSNPEDMLFSCPVKRGLVGVDSLNAALRECARGAPEGLSAGMPVVLEREQPGLALKRGERGVVRRIDGRTAVVDFDGVELQVSARERFIVSPGFCMTAHRAGGCLARCAVFVVTAAHGPALTREVVYNASLCAVERLFILAEPEALTRALTHSDPERRGSWLPDLLKAIA